MAEAAELGRCKKCGRAFTHHSQRERRLYNGMLQGGFVCRNKLVCEETRKAPPWATTQPTTSERL